MDILRTGLDFLSTMKIPLLSGRTLTPVDFSSTAATAAATLAVGRAHDAAEKAAPAGSIVPFGTVNAAPIPVLINRMFARTHFPNQNPIGKHISEPHDSNGPQQNGPHQPGYVVVGIVGDAKYYELRDDIQPTMYMPLVANGAYFELRTASDPASFIPVVREAVSGMDRNLPVFEISTQSEKIDQSLFQERLMARVSGFFGVLTLALACFGLYGLLSYEVAWRTRELGIRMALGAQSRDILNLVIKQVVVIIAIGLATGIAIALGVTRFMSNVLYNVRPNDPATPCRSGRAARRRGAHRLLPARPSRHPHRSNYRPAPRITIDGRSQVTSTRTMQPRPLARMVSAGSFLRLLLHFRPPLFRRL